MTTIYKTDSMSVIQEKLDKGGEIIFSPGTYKITKQLVIPKNTIINLNTARLQRKASIQSIFINKVTQETTGYNGDGNIDIVNGILEGIGGYTFDNLVTFFHSHDIHISNCEFRDILCHGVELNSTKNVSIHNCTFRGYNLKDPDNAYKEMIQIDQAGFSAFVLRRSSTGSPCYDGTCCENIEINSCLFDKSNTRDYPYACIGAHAQMYNVKKKHKHIQIFNNTFHCKFNTDIIQPCISIINMEDITVDHNVFDCMKVARIYSKSYSYTLDGVKREPHEGDGLCKDISFTNNFIQRLKTNKEAFQQYNKSSTKSGHTNIVKKKNTFDSKCSFISS